MFRWFIALCILLVLPGCFESKHNYVDASKYTSDSRALEILNFLKEKDHFSSFNRSSDGTFYVYKDGSNRRVSLSEIDSRHIMLQIFPIDKEDLYRYYFFASVEGNVKTVIPVIDEQASNIKLLAGDYGIKIIYVSGDPDSAFGGNFSLRIINRAEEKSFFDFLRVYVNSDLSDLL